MVKLSNVCRRDSLKEYIELAQEAYDIAATPRTPSIYDLILGKIIVEDEKKQELHVSIASECRFCHKDADRKSVSNSYFTCSACNTTQRR